MSVSPGDEPLQVYWVNQYAIPPDRPGGTRHFEMGSELRRRGVDCRIVASDLALNGRDVSRRRGPWSMRSIGEDVAGVPFTWLSAGRYGGADWQRAMSMLVFSIGAFLHLLRVPVRRGRTVFVGSSPHLFAASATWLAAKVRRVPHVFEVRDLWPESYVGVSGRSGGAWIGLLRLLADTLYRRSAAVVVLTAPNREDVIARGADPARVHVIPNGVDLEGFDADVGAPDLHRDGRFTFVYAGAHGPANGLDVVVEACRLLDARGEELVRVVLIGDGPARAAIAASASGLPNLELHDPVPKAAVPGTLRTADAALMVLAPVELFTTGVSPNKLFDYLAVGLPVVTNVPGVVAGMVAEAGAGTAVAPGDPSALAEAMVAMSQLTVGELATLYGGRAWIAANHDRRVLAGRLHDVLMAASARR